MEPPLLNRIGRTLTSHLRTTMVAGVLILVPLVLTYLVLRLVFDFIDGVLQPAIEQAIDRRLPGLGILVLIVLIYIAGLVGANRVGNRSIDQVRAGRADAFAEIVERYQAPIFRYLLRMTGDYQVAQDLAQDTFLNAYESILKTRAELSLKAWLYRIATNNAL